MAFVEAVKNRHYIKVSKSAYDSIFKKKGYRLVDEAKKTKEEVVDDFAEEAEHEVVETEVPVSEMNKEQLMRFAKVHNINTKSAKNVAEARRIIQRAVKEAKL